MSVILPLNTSSRKSYKNVYIFAPRDWGGRPGYATGNRASAARRPIVARALQRDRAQSRQIAVPAGFSLSAAAQTTRGRRARHVVGSVASVQTLDMSRWLRRCAGVMLPMPPPLLLLLLLPLHCVTAIDRAQLFPFGATHGDERLDVGDDVSSPEVQLRTPIVFYDDFFSSLYVSVTRACNVDRPSAGSFLLAVLSARGVVGSPKKEVGDA